MKPGELSLEALERAASLPPDDPLRQEVEEACAQAGGDTARRWLECLNESENLRLELHRVAVPEDLGERLRTVPERSKKGWRAGWMAAACLVILLGSAAGLLHQQRVDLHKKLVSLGILAINTHINDRRVSVRASSPRELERRLAPELPYPLEVPQGVGTMRLVGGRRAHLGAYPVIYTLWASPGGETSVIQIRLSDFDLHSLARQEVDVRSKAFDPHPCHVTIWTEGAMGYLLVTDTHS